MSSRYGQRHRQLRPPTHPHSKWCRLPCRCRPRLTPQSQSCPRTPRPTDQTNQRTRRSEPSKTPAATTSYRCARTRTRRRCRPLPAHRRRGCRLRRRRNSQRRHPDSCLKLSGRPAESRRLHSQRTRTPRRNWSDHRPTEDSFQCRCRLRPAHPRRWCSRRRRPNHRSNPRFPCSRP